MGYNRKTTPTIDKMARKGLYYENAIAASVPTPYSIFSSFTGHFPLVDTSTGHRPEIWRREFKSKITIASLLRQIGYSTIAVHKHPWASKYFGFDKGFEYFSDYDVKVGGWNSILENVLEVLTRKGKCVSWEDYYEEILERVYKAKRPYFLWVFLLDTHWPCIPSDTRKLVLPSTLYLLYNYWCLSRRKWLYNKEIKIIKNAYDNSIRYADTFIKRLWNDLKEDDPVFIIHADHGEGFGEHGFYAHPPMLYEELIHIPLVIYNADIKGKIKEPVSLLSLSSSILELVGEESRFPSESFLNGGKDWVISKVFDKGKRKIAVRMKEWKYIEGQKEKGELYNLRKDPTEQENLVNDYPNLVKEFKNIIRHHIEEEKRKIVKNHLRRVFSS